MKETMNNNFGTEEKILVIAIDHGFGNMKTVNTCFKTGVVAYDSEPTFKNNLLVYGGRYFKIGEGHKEFIADKIQDEDYYILTLAAIAREMSIRKEVVIVTEDEKKLLQAQHRLEEAQARDRVKERKARTRRLIQEGAILEKVFPSAAGMDLMELERELERKLN